MVGLILVMVMLDSLEDWLSKSISGDGASGGVAVKISKMLLSLVQLLKFLHMEFQRLMNLEIQSLRDEMALLKADLDKQCTLLGKMHVTIKALEDELASQQKLRDELEARVASQLARQQEEFDKSNAKK
ncbi:unnamed protein product [Urochloa humidicola]